MAPKLLLAAALAAVSLGAAAQDQAVARSLAATCAGCHGTDGRSATTSVAPLAGMQKDYMIEQMRLFRDGKRAATIMHQLAKGYTDAQIDLIAGYLAAQPKR